MENTVINDTVINDIDIVVSQEFTSPEKSSDEITSEETIENKPYEKELLNADDYNQIMEESHIDFDKLIEIFFNRIQLYKISMKNKRKVLTLTFLGLMCNLADQSNIDDDKDEHFYRTLITEQLQYHHKMVNGIDESIDDCLSQEQFDEIYSSFFCTMAQLNDD